MAYLQEGMIQTMIDASGGEPVTIGSVTLNGLVDIVDEEMLVAQGFGSFIGKSVLVRVKTGAFPALADGVAVTVRAVAYKARAIQQEGDGALTQVLCATD